MLLESPSAFGGTHDENVGNDEQSWRQRLLDNVVLLARVGPTPAASAMYSVLRAAEPGDCSLYGMWVDPHFRRSGVGRALVEAVVAQARVAGRRRVLLHVVDGNFEAARLYENAGFVATGHTVPHPHVDALVEREMELVLEAGLLPPPNRKSSPTRNSVPGTKSVALTGVMPIAVRVRTSPMIDSAGPRGTLAPPP